MDMLVVPALDLGGAATVAAGAAAIAAGQVALAAVQAATPRSTVQQLQDNGIMPERIRRLSHIAQRASISVISAQQEWLLRNMELMSSPRSPGADGLAAAAAAAVPAMMTRATSLAEVPQALAEGRVFFSAKLAALMAATSGALVWRGVFAIRQDGAAGGVAASEIEASDQSSNLLGVAIAGVLLLFGAAAFLAGRTSAPVVGWQREESSDGQGDGSKKKGRLQRAGPAGGT